MTEKILNRVFAEAHFILDTGATVRACAEKSGVGKTTVHKDMRVILPRIDKELARKVGEILDRNREERHLRGGEATRRKYREFVQGRGEGLRGAPRFAAGKPPGQIENLTGQPES